MKAFFMIFKFSYILNTLSLNKDGGKILFCSPRLGYHDIEA